MMTQQKKSTVATNINQDKTDSQKDASCKMVIYTFTIVSLAMIG